MKSTTSRCITWDIFLLDKDKDTQAVKNGFCWPVIFFGPLYAWYKRMFVMGLMLWLLAIILLILRGAAKVGLTTGFHSGSLSLEESAAIGLFFLSINIVLVIWLGDSFNKFRKAYLKNKGYKLVQTNIEASSGHEAISLYKKQSGGQVISKDNIGHKGFTELMWYAADGQFENLSSMLDSGVNIDTQDERGATALMYASRNGHFTIVKALIARGADKELKTNSGYTASDFAIQAGYPEIEKY